MSSKGSLHREELLPKHDGKLSFLQHLFLLLSRRKCCKCWYLQTPEISTNAEATTQNHLVSFITAFPLAGKVGKPEETVPMSLPHLHIPKFFGAFLKMFPSSPLSSVCRDTRAIVHSCRRLKAEIAAHYPSTSPHARTSTCHQPPLTPDHTWATSTLLQPQVPLGGDSSGQVTSACLPLSSLCHLN